MESLEGSDFGGANEQRRIRKTGRRANVAKAEEESPKERPSAPKQGGWGAETTDGDGVPPAVSGLSAGSGGFADDDDDDVVDMIPCLEEEEEEDITRQVAAAPRVTATHTANRIMSLRELDKDKAYQLEFGRRGGPQIDLSLLMSHLTPQGQLSEPDELWDYEFLIKDVKDEIQKEKDALDDHGQAVEAAT